MTFEILSRGNSLHHHIMDAENDIRVLEEWIKELKQDATVMISSYSTPQEKFIVELHGSNVLHLVERRLNELKEHLKKLKAEFNSL